MIITQTGYDKLLDEKIKISNVDLVEATKMLEETRPIGVSDEFPPEYLMALDTMNRIEKKLSDISAVLSSATIVNASMVKDKSKVGFGAKVELEREDGAIVEYMIVSSYESDINAGKISIDCPMAKEMFGMKIDEIFEVNGFEYTINKISYESL